MSLVPKICYFYLQFFIWSRALNFCFVFLLSDITESNPLDSWCISMYVVGENMWIVILLDMNIILFYVVLFKFLYQVSFHPFRDILYLCSVRLFSYLLGIPSISDLEILSISMNYFSFITKSLHKTYTSFKSAAGTWWLTTWFGAIVC